MDSIKDIQAVSKTLELLKGQTKENALKMLEECKIFVEERGDLFKSN